MQQLTAEALADLASALIIAGVPRDPVGPLSNGDPSKAFASLGLRVPAEAELWFTWDSPVRDLTPYFEVIRVDQAVEQTVWGRQQAAEWELKPTSVDAAAVWPPSWFTLGYTGTSDLLVIDCSDASVAPVILHHWEFGPGRDVRPQFVSLGDFVAAWTAGLRSGGAHHDGLRWHITDHALAREMNLAPSP